MIPGPAVFRSALASDLDAVCALIRPDAATPLTAEGFRSSLADRQYRPEWTWIAADEDTGDVLAAAIWWGAPMGSEPGALDAFYVHESVGDGKRRTALAAELLKVAH